MSQLWQHENGFWYVLYGERLRRRASTGTRDRVLADRKLAQFIIAESQPKPVGSPELHRLFIAYEEDAGLRVRSRETMKYALVSLNRHLGHLRVADLGPKVIRQYAKERALPRPDAGSAIARRSGAGSATILRDINVLRAALSWAVEHKWITKDEKPIISAPVATSRPRNRWLTKTEASALLANSRAAHVKLFIQIGLATAARTAAILELKWDQVDLESRRIDYGEGHGNKHRVVAPINPQLHKALTAAKELACADSVIDFYGEPIGTVRGGFAKACRRAGIKGVTPHILRHTAATWMALDGKPISEIARMLGDTERTVEKVYAKHTPEYLQDAASALQFD